MRYVRPTHIELEKTIKHNVFAREIYNKAVEDAAIVADRKSACELAARIRELKK